MGKLIVMSLFLLLSLLTVFRAPTNWLWYVSILATEFSWVFFIIVTALLIFLNGGRYHFPSVVTGIISLVLFAVPVVGAYRAANQAAALFQGNAVANADDDSTGTPFCLSKMITGIGATQVPYQTFTYDIPNQLTLDFYPSAKPGKKPCVVVVHGGSWAGGDSRQLPELNSVLAKNGYQVASLNYRLAPQHHYPAPVEDIEAAIRYLRTHAEKLAVDTNNFVLLGRSAGGQIVLSAAYTLHDATIKGVIDFYGPTDMVWGYANPTNPLVLNSRKVMEDYLGGTYSQAPQPYINSSATETAAAGAVPVLMLYGSNDPLVSPLHGVRLAKKLDSLQAKYYDIYLPWATHAFDFTLNGPGGQISTWSVLRFLKLITKE